MCSVYILIFRSVECIFFLVVCHKTVRGLIGIRRRFTIYIATYSRLRALLVFFGGAAVASFAAVTEDTPLKGS